ncbi:hypothetical protein POM88_032858 [Heracleum sosnowskyi]|uniref:Uncharacterized protein n=1 Tax=Heracleum sosnowskyi TaxID=360622 RepID=A0AAD8MHX7_9APIA|nr:hypothetical protein POM88_032858 [Heracleum sosnowskyi]
MMQLGPELAVILEQLHATRATAKERQTNLEKSIRQEAHRLKDDGDHGRRGTLDRDADIVWSKGQRQLLDLESLAFSQGDLLMANRKCELPSGSYRKHNKDYEVHVPALSYADDDISEADDDHELPTLESDTVDIYAEKMSHVKILEEKITREEKLQVNNVEEDTMTKTEETEELETEYHATALLREELR